MAKKSNKSVERTYTKHQASRWQEEQRRSRIITISVSTVIVIVLILVSVVVIDSLSDDDNTTVLKVNDRSFDLDYYARMLKLNGIRNSTDEEALTKTANDTLAAMKDREIMRQLADTLGIEVSGDEIDAKIEEIFPVPEPDEEGNLPEYSDYEILLKRMGKIGISEKDIREDVKSSILAEKVQEFIGDRDVPVETAQAHVQAIMVNTEIETPQQAAEDIDVVVEGQPDAQVSAAVEPSDASPSETAATVTEGKTSSLAIAAQIKARLADGEDFASLAEAFSADPSSSREGGDLGWIPQTIAQYYSSRYNEAFERAAFDLDIGSLSEPIAMSDSADNTKYWLLEPLEREDSRVLDEGMRNIFEYKTFNDWYSEQKATFVIEDLLNPDLRNQAIAEALG